MGESFLAIGDRVMRGDASDLGFDNNARFPRLLIDLFDYE
jgi:hypothetical protein